MKGSFVALLQPVVHRLAARGVPPTAVTLSAIPIETATIAVLLIGTRMRLVLLLVPPLVLMWMGSNAIDGVLARSTRGMTVVGAALNEFVDRLGDLLVIGGAYVIAPRPLALLVSVGLLATELVAAIGWAVVGRREFRGPMGKPDRAVVLALGALAGVVWPPALVGAFATIGVGCWIGTITRCFDVLVTARALDAGGPR